ncbi:hypothetical protein F8388_019270 [Cannabis sativa]|uniref:Uncharacterized protein n=2 Tax=Cannabis sativa TaxID=3483 RepID=A0A7J6FR18_CANSA|nr:hypothetical protein F8388_019270 [Cannabis sativa]
MTCEIRLVACLISRRRKVKVGGSVQNKGWTIEKVDHNDTSVAEELRIRGFRIKRIQQLETVGLPNSS